VERDDEEAAYLVRSFVRPSNKMMTTTFPSRITCWWWNRHCHGVFSCGWTVRWQLEM